MKELFIAAVVDTTRLTLYRPDGSSIVLIQGDERIAGILSPANTALWSRGQPVEIELLPERENHLAAFERKSGGFKLFRVLKSAVKNLFSAADPTPEAPLSDGVEVFGQVPIGTINPAGLDRAVAEIMANAESVSAPGFQPGRTTDDDTIIAVTPSGQLIPGVEALEPHMAHAVQTDRTAGVQAFMARLGKIIERRNFMVAELLNFCKRGDLQFTDDGAILAYKILNYSKESKDVFVDCHSGKVPQKVGSFVCMDENLVDPSRRTECSTGLHIARRGYLRHFPGSLCTLVKIEPEDVIAVPNGEPDKMRVRGYHILAVLSDDDLRQLRADNPITSDATQRLLGQAMSGKHIAKLEEVKIGSAKGGDVKIRNLLGGLVSVPPVTAEPVAPVAELPTNEIKTDAPVVAPKAIHQAVKAQKAPAPVDTWSQPRPTGGKNAATATTEAELSADQKEALRLAREGVLPMREIGRRCNISDRAASRLLIKFGPGEK